MKKAKIYIPTKTSMQSGRGKQKKWLLEFYTNESRQNHLMDWQTSTDTLSEVKLAFPSKEQAIKYATKNNIKYKIIEPKRRKITIKSYADNFLD